MWRTKWNFINLCFPEGLNATQSYTNMLIRYLSWCLLRANKIYCLNREFSWQKFELGVLQIVVDLLYQLG